MAVTLGTWTFDAAHTTVQERFEEAGGGDAREIEIAGVIAGEHSVEDIEAALDAIQAAASADACAAVLSIREDRQLLVRRTKFVREVSRDALLGSFVLTLTAEDPFEESTEETVEEWTITASGQTLEVEPAGNAPAATVITLVADGAVVTPSFSDGSRTIAYQGSVADGETLVFDGRAGVVTLGSEDVTPYAEGVFPLLAPGEATLTYVDGASSSHAASVTVAYRDRWY